MLAIPFKASRPSIGTANITVFDWSLLKSFSVDKVLKCNAPGAWLIILAAIARLFAASTSPLALVITACFSLSASATLAITLYISSGSAISFNSTFSTFIPHGSVSSSTILQISVLNFSLSVNNSSKETDPTIFLIVV